MSSTACQLVIGLLANSLTTDIQDGERLRSLIHENCSPENSEETLWGFLLDVSTNAFNNLPSCAVDYCEPCLDVVRSKARGDDVSFEDAVEANMEALDNIRRDTSRILNTNSSVKVVNQITNFPTNISAFNPAHVLAFCAGAVAHADDSGDFSDNVFEEAEEALAWVTDGDLQVQSDLANSLLKFLQKTNKKAQSK